MKKFFSKGQKGFTLIELLIVIAILGVLAAVVIPAASGMIKSAKVASANAELGMVNTAIAAGMADVQTGTVVAGGILSSTAGTLAYGGTNVLDVGSYIQGSITKIVGTYGVGTDGYITSGAYPGILSFTSGGKFVK